MSPQPRNNKPSLKSIQSTGAGLQQSSAWEKIWHFHSDNWTKLDRWLSVNGFKSVCVSHSGERPPPLALNILRENTCTLAEMCQWHSTFEVFPLCFLAVFTVSLISLFLWEIMPFMSLPQLLTFIHLTNLVGFIAPNNDWDGLCVCACFKHVCVYEHPVGTMPFSCLLWMGERVE